jgi:transcriptional regulator with XRE-family HTH domain
MIERIKRVISHTGLSERAFAESIGVKQNTLNQQLKGERGLSLETITKILITYEIISAEWLLRGEGEMLKGNQPQQKETTAKICGEFEIDENGYLKLKI